MPDHTSTTHAERGQLHGYRLPSGYGLRAPRAFTWFLTSRLLEPTLLAVGARIKC
ncbi:hypothetical protein C9F11_40850 [Streptomyces sp. YIM 121038]|uniref:hypothetical protein n=1 Tax=Streptomyces sp. YIM 121038 TaxID=2136401 RepID=UPI001164FAD2|nr:hypothetical protein [Streptomyces sp. YIM 121038]QCX81750.1 hypothetical protein C9F11_40850 [Streptomyces sp. YIM 121038]